MGTKACSNTRAGRKIHGNHMIYNKRRNSLVVRLSIRGYISARGGSFPPRGQVLTLSWVSDRSQLVAPELIFLIHDTGGLFRAPGARGVGDDVIHLP